MSKSIITCSVFDGNIKHECLTMKIENIPIFVMKNHVGYRSQMIIIYVYWSSGSALDGPFEFTNMF